MSNRFAASPTICSKATASCGVAWELSTCFTSSEYWLRARLPSVWLKNCGVSGTILFDKQHACRTGLARVRVDRSSRNQRVRTRTKFHSGVTRNLDDHRARHNYYAKISRVEVRPVLESGSKSIEPPVRSSSRVAPKDTAVLAWSCRHPLHGIRRKQLHSGSRRGSKALTVDVPALTSYSDDQCDCADKKHSIHFKSLI